MDASLRALALLFFDGGAASAGMMAPPGIAPNGIAPNGIAPNGIAPKGIAPIGIAPFGIAPIGVAPNGIEGMGGSCAIGGRLEGTEEVNVVVMHGGHAGDAGGAEACWVGESRAGESRPA